MRGRVTILARALVVALALSGAAHPLRAGLSLAPIVTILHESAATLAVNVPSGDLVTLSTDCRTACVRIFAPRTLALRHTILLPGTFLLNAPFNPQSLLVDQSQDNRAVVTTFLLHGGTAVGGFVTLLDVPQGRRLWTRPSAQPPLAVVMASRARRVLSIEGSATVPCQPGYLRVIAARTGRIISSMRLDGKLSGVLVDDRRGRAFVLTQPATTSCVSTGAARLHLLDLARGQPVRTTLLGQDAVAPTLAPGSGRLFVLSSGTDARYSGRVTTLAVASERVLRSVSVGSMPRMLAVDEVAERVYCLNYGYPPAQGSLSILDVHSGALVRTVPLSGGAVGLVTDAARGHVVVTVERRDRQGQDVGPGEVRMLAARDGRLLHRVVVGDNPSALAVDNRTARVFVSTLGRITGYGDGFVSHEQGQLVAVDARSGQLRYAVAVGVAPSAIAVDERGGRAFVLNRGGTVQDVAGTRAVAGSVTVIDATH